MTMYAWAEIHYGDKDGKAKVAKPGDSVTASKLGIDEDEWAQLVEARSVRKTKYPDLPRGFTGSPRDFILEQRKKELADVDDIEEQIATTQLEAEQETDEVIEEQPETEDE